MEILKESFRKNELPYTLIKRNEKVALYGVGGYYTDEILHYEVCKIHIINNDFVGHREVIPGNELFGKEGSRAFNDYDQALKYFAVLTERVAEKDKTLK